jgi:hypothetical protein
MLHVMKSSAESSMIGGTEIPADRRYCIATIYDGFKNRFRICVRRSKQSSPADAVLLIARRINNLLRTIGHCQAPRAG